MTTIKKNRLVFDFRNFRTDDEGTIRCEYRVKTIDGRNVKVNDENDGFFYNARIDENNSRIGFNFRFAIKEYFGVTISQKVLESVTA